MRLTEAQRRFLESNDKRYVRGNSSPERTMWALRKKGAITVADLGYAHGCRWYSYEPTDAGRAALAGAK